MTKRSRTILTVSVRFPVPAEMGEKTALETFKKVIASHPNLLPTMNEAIIKLEKKEVIYL